MKNFDHQLQILKENYKDVEGGITLREYVEAEAQSDPGFYRWFFKADLEQDFDTSLTDEQRAEFAAFLESL